MLTAIGWWITCMCQWLIYLRSIDLQLHLFLCGLLSLFHLNCRFPAHCFACHEFFSFSLRKENIYRSLLLHFTNSSSSMQSTIFWSSTSLLECSVALNVASSDFLCLSLLPNPFATECRIFCIQFKLFLLCCSKFCFHVSLFTNAHLNDQFLMPLSDCMS